MRAAGRASKLRLVGHPSQAFALGALLAAFLLGSPASADDPESPAEADSEVSDARLWGAAQKAVPIDEARVRGWVERGPSAVPELTGAVESSKDLGTRVDAMLALARFGPRSQPAVPALIGVLRRLDGEPETRPRSGWAGQAAESGVAARALAAIGDGAVAPLIAALGEPGTLGRRVGEALASMGASATPALLEGLPSRPRLLRERIAKVLGESRPVLPDSVSALERLAAEDAEWEVRYSALKSLEQIGPPARSAVPTLLKLTYDRAFADTAAEALAAVGGEPRRVAEVLIERLWSGGDLWGRRPVVTALGRVAAEAPEALDALVEALRKHPSSEVRVASARSLGELGPAARGAVIPLILATDDEGSDLDRNRTVREESNDALDRIGAPDPSATEGLVALLEHEQSWVRMNAAKALGRIGPPARAAVPALAAGILKEGAWGGENAEAIALIGEAGPEVVAILEEGTRVREPVRWNVSQESALALAQLGKGREAALRYFRRQFNSRLRSDEVKIPAAEGLRRLGEEESRVLRFLTDLVWRTAEKANEPWVAQRATDVLARYGPKAERAVPAIVRWLELRSDWYQDSGLAALAAIGTPSALDALRRFGPAEAKPAPPVPEPLPRLRGPTPVEALAYSLRNAPKTEERARSARELGALGEAARPARFALLFAAGDEASVAEASAAALERLGPAKPGAVEGLQSLLYDRHPGVAVEAAKELGRIGPPAAEAASTLASRVRSYESSAACPAARALGRIGVATPEVLSPLKEALAEFGTEASWDLALCAAHALIDLGQEREPVRAFFSGLLDFDSPSVRDEGLEGLKRLGATAIPAAAARPGPAAPAALRSAGGTDKAPLPPGAAVRFGVPDPDREGAHIAALAFSRDGKLLAAGTADGSVRVYASADGREVKSLSSHRGPVRDVAFSPDGSLVASGGDDGLLLVHDLKTGRLRRALRPGRVKVAHLAFLPGGKRLLSTGARNGLDVWNLATGFYERSLAEQAGPLHAMALSPDGKLVATSQGYHPPSVWDAGTGARLFERHAPLGLGAKVHDLAFTSDGAFLVDWDHNVKTLHLTPVPAGGPPRRIPLEEGVASVAPRPGGTRVVLLYVTPDDGRWSMDLLDPATQARVTLFRGQTEAGSTMAVSSDGTVAAVAGPSGTALLWRLDAAGLPPEGAPGSAGPSTATIREHMAAWEDPATSDSYFDEQRRLYTESEAYDPYGERFGPSLDALRAAIDEEEYAQALPLATKLLTAHPVIQEAHDHASVASIQLGERERGLFHQRVARGLMDSVRRSGDGKTPATAYRIVYLQEELEALSGLAAGRVPQGRSSLESGGKRYDAWQLAPLPGESDPGPTIFFDVDALWKWNMRRFGGD